LDTTDAGTLGPLAWRGAEAAIDDAGDVYSVVAATNGGFSALPNAAADAAGGLPISDAGGLDLDAKIGPLTFTTPNQLDVNVLYVHNVEVTGTGTTVDPWGPA
jgi:hypothetical protein